MNAAWYLRSRQLWVSVRYWVAITGYDIRDRSGSGRMYLAYIVLFFSAWGLAVLALASSTVAALLRPVMAAQPLHWVAAIPAAALFLWWVNSLYRASRRCPIRFTEKDAVLVCATPASRPAVVFSWLVSEWFTTGLAFWAIAIISGFAYTEILLNQPDPTIWEQLPLYLLYGLRVFLPAFLAHLGMLTLAWALGCLRLQGARERHGLAWAAYGLGALGALLAWGAAQTGLSNAPVLPALLGPFLSAAGAGSYALGALLSTLWALAGLAALYAAARQLNLSRAAQETSLSGAQSLAAALLENPAEREASRTRQRLQQGRPPTRLPGRAGAWAILWKNALQLARGLTLGQFFNWALVFAAGLAALLSPDWGSRGMFALFWAVKLHEQTSQRLRKDLRLWSIFQSLPLSPQQRFAVEAGPAIVAGAALGWAALAIAQSVGWNPIPWTFYLSIPWMVLELALAAAYDVFRQTKAEHLSAANIPGPGFIAALLSVLAVAANLYFVYGDRLFGGAGLLLANVALFWALNEMVISRYRSIGE